MSKRIKGQGATIRIEGENGFGQKFEVKDFTFGWDRCDPVHVHPNCRSHMPDQDVSSDAADAFAYAAAAWSRTPNPSKERVRRVNADFTRTSRAYGVRSDKFKRAHAMNEEFKKGRVFVPRGVADAADSRPTCPKCGRNCRPALDLTECPKCEGWSAGPCPKCNALVG